MRLLFGILILSALVLIIKYLLAWNAVEKAKKELAEAEIESLELDIQLQIKEQNKTNKQKEKEIIHE
tara:strand:+ start:171 stop:371 length:201 start_codon:yes stop_codon:yes gene_type:complete